MRKTSASNTHDTSLAPIRALAKFSVSHHNKIQFVGYEIANIILVANEYRNNRTTDIAISYEMSAAIFLMIGSAAIWLFSFDRRPHMLFFGGIALTIGGLLLAMAGYILTGLAVFLASLETARGGLLVLCQHVSQALRDGRPVSLYVRKNLRLASITLGWYARLINRVISRFQNIGAFINDRPFLTSTMIKAPLRLEYIVKNILQGDIVGTMVGLSWMLLGDFALALNDDRLKASFQTFADGHQR